MFKIGKFTKSNREKLGKIIILRASVKYIKVNIVIVKVLFTATSKWDY